MTGNRKRCVASIALIVATAVIEVSLGVCYLAAFDHETICRFYFGLGFVSILSLPCLFDE